MITKQYLWLSFKKRCWNKKVNISAFFQCILLYGSCLPSQQPKKPMMLIVVFLVFNTTHSFVPFFVKYVSCCVEHSVERHRMNRLSVAVSLVLNLMGKEEKKNMFRKKKSFPNRQSLTWFMLNSLIDRFKYFFSIKTYLFFNSTIQNRISFRHLYSWWWDGPSFRYEAWHENRFKTNRF